MRPIEIPKTAEALRDLLDHLLAERKWYSELPDPENRFVIELDAVLTEIAEKTPWPTIKRYLRIHTHAAWISAVECIFTGIMAPLNDTYRGSFGRDETKNRKVYEDALRSDGAIREGAIDVAEALSDWTDDGTPEPRIRVLRRAAKLIAAAKDDRVRAALLGSTDTGSGPRRAAQAVVAVLADCSLSTIMKVTALPKEPGDPEISERAKK